LTACTLCEAGSIEVEDALNNKGNAGLQEYFEGKMMPQLENLVELDEVVSNQCWTEVCCFIHAQVSFTHAKRLLCYFHNTLFVALPRSFSPLKSVYHDKHLYVATLSFSLYLPVPLNRPDGEWFA
jgi:hypothetical protein